MHNRISYSKSKLLELAENISKLAKEGNWYFRNRFIKSCNVKKKDGVLEESMEKIE